MEERAQTGLPYTPEQIIEAPFAERVRLVCQTWAFQADPNPPIVLALYWAKYLLVYIGGWAFFVSFNAGYPGFSSFGEWAFTADAFKKAMAWSILYELTGLGCSWGPMNARFKPMVGGVRYFLRPGTTKLPLLRGVPLIGGDRRNLLDVAVFAANHVLLLRALVAPEVTAGLLIPCFILLPIMGVLDKTLFLAARAEHYYMAVVCIVVAKTDAHWIAGCQVIWCAIWFWAATSKLNRHFPGIIMFMMNNGPFVPKSFKKRLFTSFPDDLRPSRLAATIAHFGTVVEYSLPVLLLTSPSPIMTAVYLVLMTSFHLFIGLNNPNGMPVDWNILMIYGGFFLFGSNPDVSPLVLQSMPLLVVLLFLCFFVLQLFGNFFPKYVSFLLSMRYYAGNWSYNIWLFRKGGSIDKLKRLEKPAATVREQLAAQGLDEQTLDVAAEMMMCMRFMHIQGRPLKTLLPKAVDDIENYVWQEGEVIGGQVIGWNFGDGHLNGRFLLEAVQRQCGFDEGELRMITVESQPLFGKTWSWQIFDAKAGLLDDGEIAVADVVDTHPWPLGDEAAAFRSASTETA